MAQLKDCQLDQIYSGPENRTGFEFKRPTQWILYVLSKTWNRIVKPTVTRSIHLFQFVKSGINDKEKLTPQTKQYSLMNFQPGDRVRVRTKEEILPTLDFERKFHGCTFLDCMWQFCGTTQVIYKPMVRFLDERDFKFKKTRGIVLLEGVFCDGILEFGHCDRSCFLFWREEWLEKLP